MKRHLIPITAAALTLTALAAGEVWQGELQARTQDESSRAFGHPLPNLSEVEVERFAAGDRAFRDVFVRSGSINPGLGPKFSNSSCAGCHVGDGRGLPLFGDVARHSHGVLKVSTPDGKGLPGVGGQFHDRAVLGTEPDGDIRLEWIELSGKYPDGTPYRLRKPKLTVLTAAGKPLPAGTQTSLRIAPPAFGRGLLEAVPEAAILALADPQDANRDGIRGVPNWVTDSQGRRRLGRFGLKANNADLAEQTAGAYLGDMGIGNPLRPQDGRVEISRDTLEAATFYTQTLAVPARRNLTDPQVTRGQGVFTGLNCQGCHTVRLQTGPDHPLPALRNQTIYPFTDLLLHDMGPELADGRPEFAAGGRQWRTPPLWGIGLTRTVLGDEAYLHDGRARSLEEAILWHGGEAQASRDAFAGLSALERAALLAFLKSL